MSSTCAMCGTSMGAPYGGFSIPPACIQLLDGGESVDTDTVAGEATVDLCKNCTEIARRMVLDHQTSPLPECDADAVRWQHTAVYEAVADGEVSSEDLTQRKLQDALATVKLHRDGDADRLLDSKVVEAYTVVLSLESLGVIETGFFE